MFIDTHVHLNDQSLFEKLDHVLKDAKDAQVSKMIVVGYNKATSIKALEIASKYDHIYASVGFHPTEVSHLKDKDFQWLEEIAKHPKVVAIGECGFDFYWKKSTEEEQRTSFIKQIEIAKKLNKPLIIHCRDAMQVTLQTLINQEASVVGGVMHSYSGSKEMANDFVKQGFYIGIGGPITFLNAKTPKEVVKTIGPNYLLSETDAPYLTPHPYRGKENGPHHIPLIVGQMAELLGISTTELANTISINANKLFKI